MTDLGVTVTARADVISISLLGELDIASAGRLESELQRVEGAAPPVMVFDLRELDFIDSTGLRVLLRADARARGAGRRVAFVAGPESVHRVFEVALLDKRLEFVDDPSAFQGADGEG
jgi:anti-anti-sigma factor